MAVRDEGVARCCFTRTRCARVGKPRRRRPGVPLQRPPPDPSLVVFATAAQGGSDPMIAGNGDLVTGERYRPCDFYAEAVRAPVCGVSK